MRRYLPSIVLLTAVMCAAAAAESAPARLSVTSVSKGITVRVEPLAINASSYRIVVVNRSTRSLLAIQYEAFRGINRTTKGRRKAERNEPIVPAGREYAFDVQPGALVDRVAITGLLWDDGTIEGDGALAADERMFDIGKSVQLRRAIKLLQNFGDPQVDGAIRAFREQVAALPMTADVPVEATARTGMQQVKDALLKDLDQFERGSSARPSVSFATWIAETAAAYEDWLARIAAR